MRKLKMFFVILFLLSFLAMIVLAQKEENSYEEFKEVDFFITVEVMVKGDIAEQIGLQRNTLATFARDQFQEIFTKEMEMSYRARAFYKGMSLKNRLRYGRLSFLVWIMGEKDPVSYFVQARAGNYVHYFWQRKVLKNGPQEKIKEEVKQIMTQIIEELSHDYFNVKNEVSS